MRAPEPLVITWSSAPTAHLMALAREAASTWRLPLWERPRGASLGSALGHRAACFLVCTGKGWELVDDAGRLTVSPGLAMLRLKRLAAGGQMPDLLVRHAGLAPGELVIDATLGLGADARVMASVVGPRGRVIGLEASLPLAALLREGLALEPAWPNSAPIEVHHAQAATWLRAQPAKSVDVVFFDPMFEKTKASSPAFAELRRFAVLSPIDRACVDEARRVARRLVLMKSSDPEVFPALGLEPLSPGRNAFVYWGRAVT